MTALGAKLLGDEVLRDMSAKLDQMEHRLLVATPKRLAGSQAEKRSRKAAAMLLFVGSVSGFFGFLLAAVLGFEKFGIFHTEPLQHSPNGKPYASGNNYFPATVSEMVHDRNDPAGKCFFAFELLAAITILMSWYPFNLQNVYIDNDVTFLSTGISWSTLRQFLPPLGMMIVACIPDVPAQQALLPDRITVWVHTAGGVVAIGGYVVMEAKTLLHFGALEHLLLRRSQGRSQDSSLDEAPTGSRTSSRSKSDDHARISVLELRVRWVLMAISCIAIMAFEVLSLLVFHGADLGICCSDEWRVPTTADISYAESRYDMADLLAAQEAKEEGRKLLYNTASGCGLIIKQWSFWCEVISGLACIGNQLAIWWFCSERKVDMTFELPYVGPRVIGGATSHDLSEDRSSMAHGYSLVGSGGCSSSLPMESFSEHLPEDPTRFTLRGRNLETVPTIGPDNFMMTST